MAGAMVNKIMNLMGIDRNNNEEDLEEEKYDEDTYDNEEDNYNEEDGEDRGFFNNRKSTAKVVSMPQTQQVKMVISQPTTFDQAEEITNFLKERKSIILNLEYVNKDVARRIIDFISGASSALEGNIQKISSAIFLIAPYNYEIINEMAREEISNKLNVSWIKNNNAPKN